MTRPAGLALVIFFSSRRRHTRYWRDWSSDVCSSDLSSAQMINMTVCQAKDFLATLAHSPAQVYLLIMREEACVKSARRPIISRPDEQACPRGPHYIDRLIVLSFILFNLVKYASPTEGVAIFVKIATGSPRIFKRFGFRQGQQLCLTSGHFVMGFHKFQQRSQPMMGDFHVRIQQNIILIFPQLVQGFVVSFGKSPVLVE